MIHSIATPMGMIRLRPTTALDAEALRELRLEALWMHPEVFASDHDASAKRPLEWWLDRARAGSGERDQVTYVAQAPGEERNDLIAMCGLYREEGIKINHNAHLWGVYVRPAWRGLKIADALIDACEQWARERSVRVVRLAVITSNAAAIHCYQRRGFVPFGTAPQAICHNGVYFDELLMAKQIGAEV
jgi:ribosomal protein S18 acetylase RimI-like enzyme